VLVDQPSEDPPHRNETLLGWRRQIRAQDVVDRRLERIKPRHALRGFGQADVNASATVLRLTRYIAARAPPDVPARDSRRRAANHSTFDVRGIGSAGHARQARLVPGIRIVAAETLHQVLRWATSGAEPELPEPEPAVSSQHGARLDLPDLVSAARPSGRAVLMASGGRSDGFGGGAGFV
jgi:hypothetical protein